MHRLARQRAVCFPVAGETATETIARLAYAYHRAKPTPVKATCQSHPFPWRPEKALGTHVEGSASVLCSLEEGLVSVLGSLEEGSESAPDSPEGSENAPCSLEGSESVLCSLEGGWANGPDSPAGLVSVPDSLEEG